jgi:hypothetical protein
LASNLGLGVVPKVVVLAFLFVANPTAPMTILVTRLARPPALLSEFGRLANISEDDPPLLRRKDLGGGWG